jgi:hypothetical protein
MSIFARKTQKVGKKERGCPRKEWFSKYDRPLTVEMLDGLIKEAA